jgi:hypothetical protein
MEMAGKSEGICEVEIRLGPNSNTSKAPLYPKDTRTSGHIARQRHADSMVRREAVIYNALGKYGSIRTYLAAEGAVLTEGRGPQRPKLGRCLDRAPASSYASTIYGNPTNLPSGRARLELTLQFAEGIAHIHSRTRHSTDTSRTNNNFLRRCG